jgi:hypothetical protein
MGILEGMGWLCGMGHFQTRENTLKQGGNKEKPFQTRKNTNKQGKHLSSKENAFQARGIFQSNVKVYKW